MFEDGPMPRRNIWTEGQDTQIRRLRTEGNNWMTIAQTLGLSRWTVSERGRRLGVFKRPRRLAAIPDERLPLPAGHTDSWGAITRGTCLEGVPFLPPGELR
jgi:hypothetical protein